MSDAFDHSDVSDQAFVDPYDYGFDEEAAAKYPEWERLLSDAGENAPMKDQTPVIADGVETQEVD